MIDFQAARNTSLVLGPRGFGKTTITTICRCIYEIVQDRNVTILIVSTSAEKARVPLKEIKPHLENNEKLIDTFSAFYSPTNKWGETEIIVSGRTKQPTPKESTVTCIGVGGQLTGRHYDVIFLADVVDQNNSRSEQERKHLEDWCYQTLFPCLRPGGRLFIDGTRWHYLDLYGHFIKNEYRDDNLVLDCFTDDSETESVWPEYFSMDELRRKRETMPTIAWNLAYRNNATLTKGNIFRDEWLEYYDTPPDWSKMRHFLGCDPAATRKASMGSGSKSDYWTIVVGAAPSERQNLNIYIRAVWRGRVTKDEYIAKLREFGERYNPVCASIENVAAQEYLAQDAEKFLPVNRVERTKDKVARAYWLQSFFENRQIHLPAKSITPNYTTYQALVDELLLFPQAQHDDLFDGLQTMVEGVVKRRLAGTGETVFATPDRSYEQ